MEKIDKQVRLLHKSLKGEITVPGLIRYLEHFGYNTVFFNTEEGDKLLDAVDIEQGETKAFTFYGDAKIVFIDNEMHHSDKLYALLHECGHIVLGHIGNDTIHLQDKHTTENEAEAFAYRVLNYRNEQAREMRKQVRLLHKSLRGEITVPGMIRYLERFGYNTVFFNTEEGNRITKAYGVDSMKNKVSSFVYNGGTKVVFVDDLSHISDKMHDLLHECGHITLGHMDEFEFHTIDKRTTECEAEAFAYAALHYNHQSFGRRIRNALSSVCDSVVSFFIRERTQKTAEEKEKGAGADE